MIDVLQLNITLLSRFRQVPEEDILKTWMTAADINGLCLLLNCLKSTAEACDAQCYQAQRQDINQLDSDLIDPGSPAIKYSAMNLARLVQPCLYCLLKLETVD